MYSAKHARRTSCHPELVPLRCCLRLCETTPVPLVQVLSLLAQCAPGVWRYQPQRAQPYLYKSLHAPLSRDLELPVFIIPPCFAWQAGLKVCRISPECLPQEQSTTSSPQPLDTMAPVIPTGKELVFATAGELSASFIDNQGAPAVDRTVRVRIASRASAALVISTNANPRG
jgi:hypothetical protein